MKISIKDKEITLKYSFRGYMIFEQVTNHAFSGASMTDFIILFYSMVMASDKELTITYDEFIDYLDENPELLKEFSEWIGDNVSKQKNLSTSKEVKGELDPKN